MPNYEDKERRKDKWMKKYKERDEGSNIKWMEKVKERKREK